MAKRPPRPPRPTGAKPARPAPPPPPAPRPKRDGDDESLKETFESIVIAFILAFVFRAYVVEAFVIPTGSMAPTLLGEHLEIKCPMCGYVFEVDNPDGGSMSPTSGYVIDGTLQRDLEDYLCPMCRYPNVVKAGTKTRSGDRILVHKYLYMIHDPYRFDVVVFKAPHQPEVNYIKRLVGRPNESLEVIEGNVYYNRNDDDLGWRIARKTDPHENPHAFEIQRDVWQPVYHSQYVPLDYGRNQPDERRAGDAWRVPWVITAGDWKQDSRRPGELDPWRGYQHESTGRGAIRFSFERALLGGPGLFPYGQLRARLFNYPVEDVRIGAQVRPGQDGLTMRIETTTRLDDDNGRMQVLYAEFDADGKVTLNRKSGFDSDDATQLAVGQTDPFAANATRTVELWYVDQEASVWVDGKRVLYKRFDIDIETVRGRPMPTVIPVGDPAKLARDDGYQQRQSAPQISIEVAGAPVTLYRVDVDRDLYYTHANVGNEASKGTLNKREKPETGGPVSLDADQFFCLGDNSPFSHDSRHWADVNPWVLIRAFDVPVGKDDAGESQQDRNEQISQELAAASDRLKGIVPRRLLMGKAFFVYYPAPHGLTDDGPHIFPNFGDMRFIH